ncbi:erv26 super protein [Coemansia javaensis]|uniref:Erv26 super protein n=1 Tax=Coemansia javaensis TaxID=2761396 RepID=A0A9W8HAB7_9FUNG|nr:erv26 super protein [Coemansia javaensis]
MGLILRALAAGGWAAGAAFAVFAVACALFVVAEWAEERPRQARRAIWAAVWAVDTVLALAALDGVSAWRALASAAANHVYALNLARFPLVHMGGALFLGSCALAVGNHVLWFVYFIQRLDFPFGQVCAFMFFGVWLVPLALFVSLAPADAALPSARARPAGPKTRRSALRALLALAAPAPAEPQPLHTE